MFRTKRKAEQAAMDGESAQEFDTQQCRELQEAIISSSPEKPAVGSHTPMRTVAPVNSSINAIINEIHDCQALENSSTRHGLPVNSDSAFPKFVSHTLKRKRDNEDGLRPSKTNGKQYPSTTNVRLKVMAEELTQKSSLSPTQENSASVYEAYELRKSMLPDEHGSDPDFSSSPPVSIGRNALPDLQSQGISGGLSQIPNSTHTGWTAHTYEENDTGHINFDGFQPTSAPDEGHLESEDPPVAPATEDSVQEHQFQPETPAPSVNPFSDKGSVMKQHELFGATQPSSIGRLGDSPTSSRPSPSVYNGFRYSQEVEPSPLLRRSEVANGISQGAVRSLLRSVSTETPVSVTPTRVLAQATSFNSGLRKPTFIREPQDHYVSMKESQERRRKLSNPDVSSDSESDSDIEPVSTTQKKAEMYRRIREDMSKVTLRRPNSSGRPSSAKDNKPLPATASMPPRTRNYQRTSSETTSYHTPQASESTQTNVEVPASGRRRSIQDDYVAQCEGFDPRDTQPTQQDMIADSQAAPISSNIVESSPVPGHRKVPPTSTAIEESGAEPTSPSLELPKQAQRPAQVSDGSIIEKMERFQCGDSNIPSLTDPEKASLENEVPLSSKTFIAPVAQMKFIRSNSVASTVPETSPATDRLKPMTEIADISFGLANDDLLDNLPGFTENTEFNEAMGLSSQQTPKRQLQFQPPITAITRSVALGPSVSSAPVSSGLSSAPSILDPPTPMAENLVIPAVRQGSETGSVDPNSREDEQSTETSDLTPPVQTTKADLEKNFPPMATTEDDAERHQRTPTEEPRLPSPKKQRRGSVPQSPPRKYRRVSKSQPKKQTYPSKTQTRPVRNTRLSSVSSTSSIPLLSTAEPDLTFASASNSSTNSRRKHNGAAANASETMNETPLPAARQVRSRKSIAPDEKFVNMMAPPSKPTSEHEDSEDPLALSTPPIKTALHSKKPSGKIFNDMAFAVSYVGAEKDKDDATRLIKQYGGRILEDGFETLFAPLISPSKSRTDKNEVTETDLEIAPSEANVGFVALIADEHSRKTKYMQALALGFPCISGRWISDCVKKGIIIDWLPYLLSAGQSTFLGGAIKSRYLRPYPAIDATLKSTFNERSKLLEGKSILIVTGKGKAGERRKPYIFLTRALGPTRLGQAQDLNQAREMLLDAENKKISYDWLYMDGKPDAEASVFEGTPTGTTRGTRKRKRASLQREDVATPLPKRIQVVNDEMIIQSLILGQLIEE
ncbi:hypothetical protein DSL72_005741 [Monilinia vaccinii-corymbosi]|uniref:BRCT domain-containing protein n=1 Tax=Monilinia vaccinii-corymbosi TaxID=61207 RepID=A0A8A3PGH6_9HELO|nr:hypothetical protein DSL72_005741 [Monilinia vaccinii-corymbosi]